LVAGAAGGTGVASAAGGSPGEGAGVFFSRDWSAGVGELIGDVAGLACEELSAGGMDGDGDADWALAVGREPRAVTKRKDQNARWK
jgi:hypothetical protein